jgi:hypothetical protein
MPSGGRSCYRWPSVGRLQFIKPIMRHTYRRPWRLPHINLRQSRHRRFWTAPEKSRNPETGAYPVCSACSCKSLQPQISRKLRKFPRHFKGHFSIGNVQVRILPGQPDSPEAGYNKPPRREKPAVGGLLQFHCARVAASISFGSLTLKILDVLSWTARRITWLMRRTSCVVVMAVSTNPGNQLRSRSSNGGGSFGSKSNEITKSYCSENMVISDTGSRNQIPIS